jgi:hypothetical protein
MLPSHSKLGKTGRRIWEKARFLTNAAANGLPSSSNHASTCGTTWRFTLGYQVGSIGQQQYQHADAPVYNQRQLASGMNLLQQVYQVHSSQSAMLTYNPFCISASNDCSMRFVIPR